MKGYETSKDYKRLKELLDNGHKVICIGPDENIGIAEYDGGAYGFGGSWAMEFYLEEYFEENCANEQIEFIEPIQEVVTMEDTELLQAARELVEAVEKYLKQQILRQELWAVKNKLKELL